MTATTGPSASMQSTVKSASASGLDLSPAKMLTTRSDNVLAHRATSTWWTLP
jgi:hypothetical protein